MFRHIVERQLDFETVLEYAQVPELMLENDSHFTRITLCQFLRDLHARVAGEEGHVEMMLSGQSRVFSHAQSLPNHSFQGVLGQQVIAHQVFRHSRFRHGWLAPNIARRKWQSQTRRIDGEMETGKVLKCRLLLPGAGEPRLERLSPRTLISVLRLP